MEQVLYKLPDGWVWHSVKKLSHNIQYGHTAKAESNGNAKFLRITDIQDGKINWQGVPTVSLEEKEISKYALNDDDLIFARSGATAGKSILIKNAPKDAVFASYLIRIVPNKKDIIPEYLSYFFLTPAYWEVVGQNAAGAAQPNINGTKLSEFIVPVAPQCEQKRIVEKLDTLLTRIDTAIEHLQESVTLADALYASELNEVFPSDADIESLTDKDGWVSLSDTCTFENGDRGKNYPSKSAFVAEGIPVVSAGNLGERYIDHKGLNYITPERYDLLRSGRIRIGDILFCLRGSLGKVAISKDIDEGVIASSLVIIRPKDRVSAEYIYKYLKSSLCQKFISYYNNGAAQPNLSAKSLGKFMLPLPNAEHQKLIVDGLDEKYQLNQKLLDGLNSKIISLQSLKASILDSAFKGEL
ncbi:restriction endonuclease subunit S [Vibrio parahaemolyticus]|uniref:restriction endonuclease subunit S n=1 Tax=Vibrio parahaemolyticus TaxID=670 RepID=UPI002980C2BF|nr:restriction endonuclease subunit S [Vibrio parahaemolyticus]MEA5316037.1 restriction endonuclease subunit S [Vibrio parahaemolyticus]